MARRVTMRSPTCGFGRPHAVRVSLERKVATRCGLDKVKRQSIKYLAVVCLRSLITQEAGMEQTKAQGVTLKKAIEGGG